MKRIFLTIATIVTLLLSGCHANNENEISDYGNDIAKAQEIAVVSPETSEVIETIDSKENIEDFVLALDLDNWTLKKLPKEATEIGSFVLSQEETIKRGQTNTDGTLYDIAAITLYDNSYIRFEISGINMTFVVSKDTANYLNGYFD